tara:strand:+ start:3673 stop:4119 length:447 start_codon:yes stop_codon:yes gene_type:complete
MGKVKVYKLDPQIGRILATVSRLTEVPISKIRGKSRLSEIVAARRICMVLISEIGGYTLTTIGGVFNRDHTTVLHAVKQHMDYMDVDKAYRDFFNICETTVGIHKIGDSKNKDDIIEKLAQRVDFLEHENELLKEQVTNVKELADELG